MHFLIDYNYRSEIHKSRRLVLHGFVTREARFWWSFTSRLSPEYLFNGICLALNEPFYCWEPLRILTYIKVLQPH